MTKKCLIGLLLCSWFVCAFAVQHTSSWYGKTESGQISIKVDLFLSSTCEHCRKLDVFMHHLEKKYPWLTVQRYHINQDKLALQRFNQLLQQTHSNNFSVPSIFFCQSRWYGFANDMSSGAALEKGFNFCRKQILQHGMLTTRAINVLNQWGMSSQFQIKSESKQTLVKLLFSIALMDAFTPCSLFGFLAFLAFLWLYPQHRKIQVSLCVLYLFSLGVIHFLQQAFPSIFYQYNLQLESSATGVAVLIALFALNYLRKVLLSKNHSALSINGIHWLFACIVVVLTAVAIQLYQQTCVFNPSLLFERWLQTQNYTPPIKIVYLLIYQLIYLFPLVLFLVLYIRLAQTQRFQNKLNKFAIAGWVMLMGIAAILMFSPHLLGNVTPSIILLVAALAINWLVTVSMKRFVR